jgi:GxxExxY protein
VEENQLSKEIVSAALEVHKFLGPGLLESAYEECLAHELTLRKISFQKQASIPVNYKGLKLDAGYRVDFMVDDAVVVELKATEVLLPIHQAQVLTYLKLSGKRLALLINFNAPLLKDNIKRIVLNLPD